MTKEQIEKIFELGADAQYRYWNPEGDADVEGFEKAKQDAVKLLTIPVVVKPLITCRKCGDYYGVNIDHKCFKCLEPLFD